MTACDATVDLQSRLAAPAELPTAQSPGPAGGGVVGGQSIACAMRSPLRAANLTASRPLRRATRSSASICVSVVRAQDWRVLREGARNGSLVRGNLRLAMEMPASAAKVIPTGAPDGK